MKKILLSLCVLTFLTGCAGMNEWNRSLNESIRQNKNVDNAIINKDNLRGLYKAVILERFGGNSYYCTTSTTYLPNGVVMEIYNYAASTGGPVDGGTMIITFMNSYVDSVIYSP